MFLILLLAASELADRPNSSSLQVFMRQTEPLCGAYVRVHVQCAHVRESIDDKLLLVALSHFKVFYGSGSGRRSRRQRGYADGKLLFYSARITATRV